MGDIYECMTLEARKYCKLIPLNLIVTLEMVRFDLCVKNCISLFTIISKLGNFLYHLHIYVITEISIWKHI